MRRLNSMSIKPTAKNSKSDETVQSKASIMHKNVKESVKIDEKEDEDVDEGDLEKIFDW